MDGPMRHRIVRIGGASGFWGDSAAGAPQLLRRAKVDYLMFDYLAEITMSIMAKARQRDPAMGYATDFVSTAMADILRDVIDQGVKVITNAGGINPTSCAAALRALAEEQGVSLRVAVVTGDDLMPMLPALREAGTTEMFTGALLPERLLTANAYLGAFPIAMALDSGADVVITGRCVDSALALGPLIHEFKWRRDDLDLLAAGTLVGHIIECGTQATGGIHTDWRDVPGWDDIGFPIAECRVDGTFVVTKPEGTGGLVNRAVVAEQLVYEIGDPADYRLPEVTCDFTAVELRQTGENRVEVSGARGLPPPSSYKVSATYSEGYRCTGGFTVIGMQAAAKGRRAAEAILTRTRRMVRESGLEDFAATEIEILGAESLYGDRARFDAAREVVVRISVAHRDQSALTIFAKELAPMGTGGPPGTTGFAAGRPKPQPVVKLFSFLLPKSKAPPCAVLMDNLVLTVPAAHIGTEMHARRPVVEPGLEPLDGEIVEVPLIRLAWARSGDKGDLANIGVIARDSRLVPVLTRELTAARVADWFSHLIKGPVQRYELPGLGAFNFVLERALCGGGMASLRNDPQGKSYAQILLEMPIRTPPALLFNAEIQR
jgi:Acyclic terpene utilisation family protein AtuA